MTPPSGTRTSGARVGGFDGLRGAAALLVVVHHALLLTPSLIAPYRDPRGGTSDPVAWAFTYTPLHLLWDGPVAVFVFFVLSGVVLTLPFRRGPRNWLSYYPARLARLFLPVWAAVALAVLWEIVLPRLQPGSAWVQGHAALTTGGVAGDLVLLAGTPGATNSALWSLRWEVVFSLTLPAFVLFAVMLRRFWSVKLAILCVLIVLGAGLGPVDDAYLLSYGFQLPIFAIGSLIAVEWERLRDLVRRVVSTSTRAALAAVLGVLLLSSYWMICGLVVGRDPIWLLALLRLMQVLGAALLVTLSGALPAWGSVLSSPGLRWLGTRSFSLYLVHEPLVTGLGRLLPDPVQPVQALLISVPVSLLAAELFFRVVERPSHRVSRRVARLTRSQLPVSLPRRGT